MEYSIGLFCQVRKCRNGQNRFFPVVYDFPVFDRHLAEWYLEGLDMCGDRQHCFGGTVVLNQGSEVERSQIVHIYDEKVVEGSPDCSSCADTAAGMFLNIEFQLSATGPRDSLAATSSIRQNRPFASTDRQKYFPNIMGEQGKDVAFQHRHSQDFHQRFVLFSQTRTHPRRASSGHDERSGHNGWSHAGIYNYPVKPVTPLFRTRLILLERGRVPA